MVVVLLKAYAGLDSCATSAGIDERGKVLGGEGTIGGASSNKTYIFDLWAESKQQYDGC